MPLEPPRRSKQRLAAPHQIGETQAHASPPHSQQRRPSRAVAVRRARRRILVLLWIVLAGIVCAAVLSSPLLSIKHIQVAGADHILPDEAAKTLRLLSLKPGTNWLLAPIRTMEQDLRDLPWVRAVRISRQFPDTIQVSLALREPQFVAQTRFGLFELDQDGVPIRPAIRGQNGSLPLMVLERPYPVHPGFPIQDDALSAVIHIYNRARQEEVVRIAKIVVDQSGNICLNMQDGIPIQLGQAQEIATKVGLVLNLYKQEPNVANRLVAINLTCPTWPACTPRDLPSQAGSVAVTNNGASPAVKEEEGTGRYRP